MTVTVLTILQTDFVPQKRLTKVMNEQLQCLAKELEQRHLKPLSGCGFSSGDLIVYISYTLKYKVQLPGFK